VDQTQDLIHMELFLDL